MAKEKKKKGLITRLLEILIALCLLAAIGIAGKQFLDLKAQTDNNNIALKEYEAMKKAPRKKKASIGNVIGKMKVDGLTDWIAIIEGEDPITALNHGAGHAEQSPYPGKSQNSGQPILSAHRETFFRPLKDAKNGDIVTVEMPYGTYKYKISNSQVVQPNEADKAFTTEGMKGERLILVTCYPFSFVAPPNERIIFYADLVDSKKIEQNKTSVN
ncbi:MAG: class D sortase [Erysipelotrichales bacterium]